MVVPWRWTTGAEPDTVKAVSPVLNGEHEETGGGPRLVLTQPRCSQQLTPGVRLQSEPGEKSSQMFAMRGFVLNPLLHPFTRQSG